MPNWCDNNVEIRGPEESIKKLVDLVQANAKNRAAAFPEAEEMRISMLQTFLPLSDYYSGMEGFNNGGYEWCLQNWGCKWPESHFHLIPVSDGVDLMFETPWSPPTEGYHYISTKFPDLMFFHYFRDEGMMFMGIEVYQNGMVIFENEIDGSYLPEFEDWSEIEDYLEDLRGDFFTAAHNAVSIA